MDLIQNLLLFVGFLLGVFIYHIYLKFSKIFGSLFSFNGGSGFVLTRPKNEDKKTKSKKKIIEVEESDYDPEVKEE